LSDVDRFLAMVYKLTVCDAEHYHGAQGRCRGSELCRRVPRTALSIYFFWHFRWRTYLSATKHTERPKSWQADLGHRKQIRFKTV